MTWVALVCGFVGADPRFWNKSHGLTICFENPMVNSKMGKTKQKYFFSTSWFDILSKKEMFVFRLYNCCAFHFILYGNSSIIKEPIKICSDHLGFFDLHNISVVETVICAFNFQIAKTWWWQQSVNFIRARLSKHGWNLTLFESFCLVIIKDWRMSQIMQTGVTRS